MGPKIVSWKSKKYDTVFRLRLLPIGGFVNMVGEDEESELDSAFVTKVYLSESALFWQAL